MKIALIGTRGVPANYGGFETCAERIAVGLVERGHEVVAYCRPGNAEGNPTEFRGVKLVYRPLWDTRATGTFSHTFNCMTHAVRQGFDVLMVFNAGNSPICVLPRLLGQKVAINVDGLEWKRGKWGKFAKRYYKFAEWVATKVANRVVADSVGIRDYYERTYNTPSTFIAYGADVENSARPEIMKEYEEKYGLEKGRYFFVVTRLESENNPHLTVEAFRKVETDMKLFVVGGVNWDSPYAKRLKESAKDDPRILFPGGIYKEGHVKELFCNCYAYVHGNEVGGTNPALLQALGYGCAVLAFGVDFNKEVVRDAALTYERDADDLAAKMRRLIAEPELCASLREKGQARIREAYQWDVVTAGYERLFERLRIGHYSAARGSD